MMSIGQGSRDARLGDGEMSDAHFNMISALAHREFGLSLAASKKALVHSRISKRIRSSNIGSFDNYISLLESDKGAQEKEELLSTLTTNVTHFFRESHHFEFLKSTVLPPLLERAKAGGRVRIWSAGCSSGQEPYSIAMTILEMLPSASQLNLKILATDIDPVIVRKAKEGRYSEEELKPLSDSMRKRYVQKDLENPSLATIGAEPRKLITLGVLNLIAPLPVRGPFDLIMCRNVAIYFDKKTQEKVWSTFASVLAPGGYLLIGHSERLVGAIANKFENVGVTAYRFNYNK